MRYVKLGQILENAARIAGRQVSVMGVPENWACLGGMAIENGLRKLAAEKFPMMERVEMRRYRPTWDRNEAYQKGNEVWWEGEYWRNNGLIGEYGEPGESEVWTKLEMKDVAAFIAWDQPWENTVIERGGVDVTRFVYAADPKYFPNAKEVKVVGMNELGITLESPAPKAVFVRFVPQWQKVSFNEWSPTEKYEAGEAVYVEAKKEVYQAFKDVEEAGTRPDEDAEHWDAVRVPEVFESYLTRLVAVDFLTEDQGKYQTRAAADKEFEELCVRFHEGNGETRIRAGRICR